jgi:hypothetical protein
VPGWRMLVQSSRREAGAPAEQDGEEEEEEEEDDNDDDEDDEHLDDHDVDDEDAEGEGAGTRMAGLLRLYSWILSTGTVEVVDGEGEGNSTGGGGGGAGGAARGGPMTRLRAQAGAGAGAGAGAAPVPPPLPPDYVTRESDGTVLHTFEAGQVGALRGLGAWLRIGFRGERRSRCCAFRCALTAPCCRPPVRAGATWASAYGPPLVRWGKPSGCPWWVL